MSERVRILIFVFGLLLIAFVIYSMSNLHQETKEIDVGYRGIARYNDFLAVERTLKRFDLNITSVKNYIDIKQPSNQDLLVLKSSATLTPAQTDSLINWVIEGGQLMIEADAHLEQNNDSTILQRLQIEAQDDKSTASLEYEHPVTIQSDQQSFRVGFLSARSLFDLEENSASWQVEDVFGLHILEYNIGDGQVTVFSDMLFITNAYLSDNDHADFFYWLVQRNGQPNKIWLQYMANYPSLWAIIWDKARYVLFSLALLTLTLIAYLSYRFGPLLANTPRQKRSLMEHVNSSGHFLWRHGKAKYLIDAARDRIMVDIEKQHPGWASLSSADQLTLLSDVTGCTPEEIEMALSTQDAHRQREFTEVIQKLRFISEKL